METRRDESGTEAPSTERGVTMAVVKWAPFRLAPGTDEAALLDAAEVMQREFLERQPGLLRRALLRDIDGSWADLVHWSDEDSVERAMTAVGASDACRRYFACMTGVPEGGPGAGLLVLRRVRTWVRS